MDKSSNYTANKYGLIQVRNQLGTPGGAKSFLRGVRVF